MLAYEGSVVRKRETLSAVETASHKERCLDPLIPQVPLNRLEAETLQWCREMMRNSPTALRILKAAMNAAEDGQAGIQVPSHPHISHPGYTDAVSVLCTASSDAEPFVYIQDCPFNRLQLTC